MTADHVGKPDAPNTLTMRHQPRPVAGNSPHKEIGAKYAAAWEKWAEAHPDWQVNFEYFSQDIGAEHARLLEQARAGRAPDCVTVDSFQLALFVKNGVLQPLDEFFSKEEIDDLFPFIREGITGPDGHIYAWWWGTDLRVLYYNTDIVKTVPQTWDELQATALEASKTGVDGVLFNGGRWEGTTFDWLANFWAQGGELVDDERQADLRRGREQGEDAEGPELLQGPGRQRRRAEAGGDDQDLRRLQRRRAVAGTTAMFLGGHWQHFQLEEAMPPERLGQVEDRRAARADPGRARDRHRRLDRRVLRQGPGEDQGLRLADARGLHGPGERGRRRPADPAVALRQRCRSSRTPTTPSSRSTWCTATPGRACRSTRRSRTRSRS